MPRARITFHAPSRLVVEGEELAADDPVIAGREHLFEDPDPTEAPVEDASADPGTKRARRPRKAAAKKAPAKKAAAKTVDED